MPHCGPCLTAGEQKEFIEVEDAVAAAWENFREDARQRAQVQLLGAEPPGEVGFI